MTRTQFVLYAQKKAGPKGPASLTGRNAVKGGADRAEGGPLDMVGILPGIGKPRSDRDHSKKLLKIK